MVKRTQIAVHKILKSYRKSTEAILEEILTKWTIHPIQRLTPINFLYIGNNRGQGLILDENLENRENTIKK